MMSEPVEDSILNRAKRMRPEATPAEALLWEKLRRNRAGFKFRRQHLIGSYIPAFYCYGAKLAIELDGAHHDEEEQREYDDARTLFLEAIGSRVTDDEVLNRTDKVLKQIDAELGSAR